MENGVLGQNESSISKKVTRHMSKKTSSLILGIVALLLSRTMFTFFDDPEGPNLLVVTVMAVIIYCTTFILYSFAVARKPFPFVRPATPENLLTLILVQILITTGIYFLL